MKILTTSYSPDWFAYANPHDSTFRVACRDGSTDSWYACYVIHGSDGVCFDRKSRECWGSFCYHTLSVEGGVGYMRFLVEKRISTCASRLHFPHEDGWWVQIKTLSSYMAETINLNPFWTYLRDMWQNGRRTNLFITAVCVYIYVV